MIVGGGSSNPRKSEDKAYALSLNPSSVAIPSCLEAICDFPHYVETPSMGIFDDGLPTVCGGRNVNDDPDTYHRECYKFNVTNNGWEYSGSKNIQGVHTGTGLMKLNKKSAFVYSNVNVILGVQAEWGLVEFGGYYDQRDGYTSDTVEFTKDGSTWETMTTNVPGSL